jgi:hypothetical protein
LDQATKKFNFLQHNAYLLRFFRPSLSLHVFVFFIESKEKNPSFARSNAAAEKKPPEGRHFQKIVNKTH